LDSQELCGVVKWEVGLCGIVCDASVEVMCV